MVLREKQELTAYSFCVDIAIAGAIDQKLIEVVQNLTKMTTRRVIQKIFIFQIILDSKMKDIDSAFD
tara:strand:- start:3633 stop:3833 length:201 start_codon:yes stop_codon:yes gene_type:complete